jgi:hypothetical protein
MFLQSKITGTLTKDGNTDRNMGFALVAAY